jgi:hypothetical protein
VSTVTTRIRDGGTVQMSGDAPRWDVLEGTEAAAKKARIPTLHEDERDYLSDMSSSRGRIWASTAS